MCECAAEDGCRVLHCEETLVFIREQTVELWCALQDNFDNGFNTAVGGPPGTGKSTEAWAWALHIAKTNKLQVTWFHFSKCRCVKVVIDGVAGTITTGYSAKIEDIETSAGTVLIVDGVTKTESVSVARACGAWREHDEDSRRFIMVSSTSVTVALEQEKEAKILHVTVGSWTFEQYELACNNEAFFLSVKSNLLCPGFENADKTQLLLSKYEFAGGCARWMFEFTYAEWDVDFTKHFCAVSNYEFVFNEAAGDETQIAVNHLRGVTMVVGTSGVALKKYFFISKHAARELAKKCSNKRKFLIASYKKADETENPAFKGWIFEFDVDYQLQLACEKKTEFKMVPRVPDEKEGEEEKRGEEVKRQVNHYKEFSSVQEIATLLKKLAEGDVLWLKPKLWCQKAYDFLCFWKNGDHLYMLPANASAAKTHSVLLNVVKQLATDLASHSCVIEAIRFEFLVPQGASFKVGAVEGRLTGWKNLEGTTQWPDNPTTKPYLKGGFIVVADVVQTVK